MTELLNPDQIFIRKLTDIILANLENESFGVKELVKESGSSLYSLNRRLRSIKKKRINQFIREVRLQKAVELLQNDDISVSEVAYQVGFSSPAYFSTCFHEFYGYTPGQVKIKHVLIIEQNSEVISKTEKKNTWLNAGILQKALSIIILVFIVVFISFPGLFERNILDRPALPGARTSIVVFPFLNMTKDTIWQIWQTGIQQSLISSLSNIGELKVKQQESINTLISHRGLSDYAGISVEIARIISKKLDADIFLYGYMQRAGASIRVDVQLLDTKTREVLKSFSVERLSVEENIIQIIDSLSARVSSFLIISKLIKANPDYGRFPLTTNSPEAFRFCLYGAKAKNTAIGNGDFSSAIYWYLKALATDSNFYDPMDGLAFAYANLGMMEQSLKWVIKAYKKRDQWPIVQQLSANLEYASYFESPDVKIKYIKQLQQIDDNVPGVSYVLGITYNGMKQYDKAIPELEKAIRLYHMMGIDDSWYYSDLGYAYHCAGQFKKEKKLYRRADRYIKDDPWIITRKIILSLTFKDSVTANNNIVKLESLLKSNSYTETEIVEWLAKMCIESGDLEKAEAYYRKGLTLDADNPLLLSSYAKFICESNRNLNDFASIIDKAIALSENKIDYYNNLDLKGYGLYKFGKCHEALEILQETWDSAPFKLNYIKSHLELAKKAISGQNE
jgi:AraC-like DNA-binding protein/tetratricopeptide (TPR) repeat protein/TolB-like protein